VQEGDIQKVVRIMLVEDEAAFRRAMAFLLDREPDIEVVAEAGSLEEARRHAASVAFDVAVLDLGLPDGNGLDLVGDLRGANPRSVALILSANVDPTNLARAKDAGADEVLDKLATPDEIISAIRRFAANA
jgi:two-component system response regulator DesR